MNIELNKEKINFLKPVFKRRFTKEETIEIIVPDALPDILRILHTEGSALLRSKDSEAGRVTLTGVCELSVLYVPESGGQVKKIETTLPFSASAEGKDITSDCLIISQISLATAESKTVNPRKIVIRAEVLFDVGCYDVASAEFAQSCKNDNIFIRNESADLKLTTGVAEKTFVFTDALKMPKNAVEIGEILSSNVNLQCTDIRPVGNKAVIKGAAETELLYCGKGDSGIYRETFETPFSQVIDSESFIEPESFEITLTPTGVYISRDYISDSDSEALALEVHVVAQCAAYANYTVNYISDAFCTKHEAVITKENFSYESVLEYESHSDSLTGTIPAGCADAHDVIVRMRQAQSYSAVNDNKTILSAGFVVTVLFSDEDETLQSVSKRLECKHEFNNNVSLTDITILPGTPFVSFSEGKFDVRVPIELQIYNRDEGTISNISDIYVDEEKVLDLSKLPSLIIVRHNGKVNLWEYAKEYLSSIEKILEANGLASEMEAAEKEILLIPKCK